MKKFNDYNFSDFLNDESFIRFVKFNQDADRVIWSDWLNANPANRDEYQDAHAYLVTFLTAAPIQQDLVGQQEVWKNIQHGINQQERKTTKTRRLQFWGYSAAASLLFALLGFWFFQSKVTITTAYGQHLTVTLPDYSIIKLNANSELSYFRAWNWHKNREIWLKGEALFEVKHLNQDPKQIKDHERFYAHAGQLNVEVLGTTFNVKYRRNNVEVALIEGKIAVQQTGLAAKPLFINPGQAVAYRNNRISKIRVKDLANKPLAWQDRKMVVSGMTVGGIIENFEDTYGSHIILDNEELRNKQIDGTISLQTKESTLYMLANILNATVEKQENTFYLRSK